MGYKQICKKCEHLASDHPKRKGKKNRHCLLCNCKDFELGRIEKYPIVRGSGEIIAERFGVNYES